MQLAGLAVGGVLLVAMIVLNIMSTAVTAIEPRGDYAKAWRALRAA